MSYAAMADFVPVAMNVGTSSAIALPGNPARQFLSIQNNTGGVLYVNFSAAATTGSFQIAAGQTWEPGRAPTNAVHVMAATAGPAVIIEGR